MSKIPCAVIRDLLPSYVEHLTSEETGRLIEEHVEECAPCKKTLQLMQDPFREEEKPSGTDADPERDTIDFLRKNRRRNIRIVVLSLAAAALIAFVIVFINRYVTGYYYFDPSGELFSFHVQVEDDMLEADITSVQNIYKITGVRFSEENDTVSMEIRAVPAGLVARLFYGDGYHGVYRAGTDISRVEANGRIVWQSGTDISMMANRIFRTAHPYVGDMSANQMTANALNLRDYLGPYVNELQTEHTPYGWKLLLEEDFSAAQIPSKEREMEHFAFALLGTIGNLDEVTFVFHADGKPMEKTITTQEASDFFGQDIKVCMEQVDCLEELLYKTELIRNGSLRIYTDRAIMGVSVINSTDRGTDDGIVEIRMDVYAGGTLQSSEHAANADGSPYTEGALCQFMIESGNERDEIAFTVTTQNGTQYEIPERIRIPAGSGYLHDIHIVGNARDGFSLKQ